MKIGAFQFAGSGDIPNNLAALKRGITLAAEQNVRFLLTQECALSGYPPLETPTAAGLNFEQLQQGASELAELARKDQMFIALGSIQTTAQATEAGYQNTLLWLTPDGSTAEAYSKKALWGWDSDNFVPGQTSGLYEVDGVKLGLRICFEIRFPEYFRELFKAKVQLAAVSFCDVSNQPFQARYELIKAHLLTRAVENGIYVLSANGIAPHQTAPTCLIDPDGTILAIAPPDQEYLLTYELPEPNTNFGREGRISISKQLLNDQS